MKIFLIAFAGIFSLWSLSPSNSAPGERNKTTNKNASIIDYQELLIRNFYSECELEDKLEYPVFKQALAGYNSLGLSNKKLLSIIDYSQPSNQKRFFIIDVENHKLLFQTLVAHGKNSGLINATRFSNKKGSHKSSLGFYRTGTTYVGRRGYSLVLEGLEKGINDNARLRGIVIHGANYVSERFITGNNSMIGRSWGCPAVSNKISREIIDLIKGGSCLYIYAEDEFYKERSMLTSLDDYKDVILD
ncbi:MAG: murein L,D-transpeptidase catalytic domain family protein [Ignavibacteria bacterium]|nr:murein L,D-transpeptidase catalytic domain family protein [Ignavibacteria bacterium]